MESDSLVFKELSDLSLPFSLTGLSIILISRQIDKKNKLKYLLIILGITGLIISFMLFFYHSFINGSIYEDKVMKFQSIENKNERIVQQYMDEGAMGSHWREVRIIDICCGIRYTNRFCETTLNGKWLKFNSNTMKNDTLIFDNYKYTSEINARLNWTSK